MKNDQDVISEFNELVNMTADDLESWLKSDDSNSAGWPKNEGEEGGETVGHDSGRKIVEILRSNPKKDADKYSDDQVQHMRKVVSYCKRHLAQESAGNKDKSEEELKKTKSYASLKNWGHDFLKAKGSSNGTSNGTASKSKSATKSDNKANGKSNGRQTRSTRSKTEKDDNDDDENDDDEEDDEEEYQEDDDDEDEQEDDENEEEEADDDDDAASEEQNKTAGDKRKKTGQQTGAKKKRETRKGASTKKQVEENNEDEDDNKDEDDEDVEMAEDDDNDDEEEEDEEEEEEDEDGDDDNAEKKQTRGAKKGKQNGSSKQSNGGGAGAKKGPKKGDTVSWSWGSGNPKGKVLDVKGEDTTITTKRGNEVSRKGDPEDPAVVIDTGKSKAIKSNHELN